MFLNSVDDGQVSGQDGKKANWQGVFSLTKKRSQLVFVIEKGRLIKYKLTGASDELTIKDEWIKTDSTKIIKLAILNFGLQPSPKTHPFSHGYHYRIIRDQKNIFLAVNGLIEGKEAEIYFDPKTGQYMGRTEATN
ncbi:hypothetical protein LRR81_13465 [Metabacillus sp. GX 13764]|uniref:hypothetical protein n=1 Tax=Metabacillus kandeliae TaxID=2900151 RepID=UPI001E405B79|nr:hypothetical protein [Metabacillus kandeliae]MCD7035250.1 hypothetical protein [Metabacillus kandeliae]